MEVRIRPANDSESRFLAEIPFRPEVIDSIIPTLGGWGVIAGSNGPFDQNKMVGQFRDDGLKAYFEVVIGDGE